MKKIFLFILCLFPLVGGAQSSESSKSKNILRKNFYQVNVSYMMWQESIDATTATELDGEMRFQFHGFKLGAAYQKPFTKFRWLQHYGVELAVGQATGRGISPNFTEDLEDQLWMSGSLNPGIFYRTTAISEIGLLLPLAFRTVKWAKDDQTNLTVDRESTLSVGATLAFVNRFSVRSSVLISVTHHNMWDTTIWAIGWQHDFK